MAVKRIVPHVATEDIAGVHQFYADLFGLEKIMDHDGRIITLAPAGSGRVQIMIAREGGSGTPVPDMSIEVSDVDATYARAREMGAEITYDITDEPWGVRRFYLRDPAGKLLNVLSHI